MRRARPLLVAGALAGLLPSLPLGVGAVAEARRPPQPPPNPDDELAKSFFKTGQDLYSSGEFLDAAKNFEHAYQKMPQSAFLYNIAVAYDKGGDRDKAVSFYRRYVDAMPAAREVAVAKARIDVLERESRELADARAAKEKAEAQAKQPAARALPAALPFIEPTTKFSFQTWIPVAGAPYTLLGAGARRVFGFKVYAMGLYVEDEASRRAFPKLAGQAGGADHDTLVHSQLAYQFVVLGDFGKLAWLHFSRDVKGKDTRDAYREALGDDVSDAASPELRKASEQFLALFDDVKEGDDLLIATTTAGEISVTAHGQRHVGPTNQRLAHDIWDIWLGDKPISSDLKKSIVDRIDTLGR